MMRLLDTNALSDLMAMSPMAARRLTSVSGEDKVAKCVIAGRERSVESGNGPHDRSAARDARRSILHLLPIISNCWRISAAPYECP